jgi:outer membrane protein OmpA-like peptidoglycan-associated protein
MGLMVPALLVVVAGCATRGWVREQMSQQGTEFDQRLGSVDSRAAAETKRIDGTVNEQAQRIEGMGFRMQTVEKQVGEVGEATKTAQGRADAAYGRADSAFNRADEVDGRLTRLWSNRNQRTLVDAVNVHFGFNRADLSDAAQTALLTVVKELKENPNLTVELQGFTDSSGPKDYNIQLSQRRVEAVRRYLIEQGADMPRINSVGLGPITEKSTEAAKNRRVTVRLMVATE